MRQLGEHEYAALARLAAQKRLTPLVRRALVRCDALTEVPAAARMAIDGWAKWHALHSLRQGVAIARLLNVLAAAGFRPIALKGLSLAHRIYPEPSLRPLRDIDLLLPQDQATAAQKLLLENDNYGFAKWAGRYGIEHGHQLPELRDEELGLTIEIHHRLNYSGWRHHSAPSRQERPGRMGAFRLQ